MQGVKNSLTYSLNGLLGQFNGEFWNNTRLKCKYFFVSYSSWLILIIFLFQHYSAVFTSYLTKVPSPSLPYDLKHLVMNEKWKDIPIFSTS